MRRQLINRNLFYTIILDGLISIGLYQCNKEEETALANLPTNLELPENIETIPTAPELLVQVDKRELDCLSLNIYHEAGDQSIQGKEAIALVVFARMRSTRMFANDVCGVVYQRKQFSWTWLLKNHTPRLHNSLERKAWEESQDVAMRALRGEIPNFLGNSTHYYSAKVMKRPPYWITKNNRMKYLTTIGDHVFYIDSKLSFSEA